MAEAPIGIIIETGVPQESLRSPSGINAVYINAITYDI